MNFPKSNLHTHTVWCDGADTPVALAEEAIRLGMETLGFSGHSATSFFPEGSMFGEREANYQREVNALKRTHGDRIRIFCGIEQDYYSDEPAVGKGYDFIIGSLHEVFVNGQYFPLDYSREATLSLIREQFSGDVYRFTACYYETLASLIEKTGCDIVGHFDLVEKYNEGEVLFSRKDPRYRRAALDALDALIDRDPVFEINTGAISRGHRTVPYPDSLLLRRIAERRGRVTLNSDAHKKEDLMRGFEVGAQLALSSGVGALTVLTDRGFELRSFGR